VDEARIRPDEFGGFGLPHPLPPDAQDVRLKSRKRRLGENTTIAVIATDAVMTKAAARRLAIAAHDGFARAIWPAHTPIDGDLVFALATGRSGRTLDLDDAIDLYAAAGATMARAIARGVHAATSSAGDVLPIWSER
jgi:L-aminopeptidase/D-esterase-like protein